MFLMLLVLTKATNTKSELDIWVRLVNWGCFPLIMQEIFFRVATHKTIFTLNINNCWWQERPATQTWSLYNQILFILFAVIYYILIIAIKRQSWLLLTASVEVNCAYMLDVVYWFNSVCCIFYLVYTIPDVCLFTFLYNQIVFLFFYHSLLLSSSSLFHRIISPSILTLYEGIRGGMTDLDGFAMWFGFDTVFWGMEGVLMQSSKVFWSGMTAEPFNIAGPCCEKRCQLDLYYPVVQGWQYAWVKVCQIWV